MSDSTTTYTAGRASSLSRPVAEKVGWTDADVRAVDTARVLAADAVENVGNGHPGTAMSLAPLAYLLYQNVMVHDPADPHWLGRDRFVLSAGHSSLTQYVQLYLNGYGLELSDLRALRTWGSATPGHPEVHHTTGVEITTGPLGSGMASAVGMAMAQRRQRGLLDPDAAPGESPFDHHVWVIASDGDIMEGVTSEASSLAGHQELSNLTVVYDQNFISIEDDTDISFSEDVAKRYEAYGWHVETIDWRGSAGSAGEATEDVEGVEQREGAYVEDVDALHAALQASRERTDRPTLIVLRTIIAWPAPEAQDTGASHGSALVPTRSLRPRSCSASTRSRPSRRSRRCSTTSARCATGAGRRTRRGSSATTPGARRTPTGPRCSTGSATRPCPRVWTRRSRPSRPTRRGWRPARRPARC